MKCELCLEEFESIKGRKYCKECSPVTEKNNGKSQVAHKTRIRQAYKKALVNLFGNKCVGCGFEGHQSIYDFHHINPKEKSFAISTEGVSRGWLKVLKEARKTVMLCKNCHSIHHHTNEEVDFSNQDYSKLEERIALVEQNIENKKLHCSKCGDNITRYSKSGLCSKCSREENRVVERPEPLDLAAQIVRNGFELVGRDYGVSGNAIKKWCKSYNIPHLKKELKAWYIKQTE